MVIQLIKQLFKLRVLRIACYLLVSVLISINFGRYLHMYYTHMSKEYPFSSQYGLKELSEYIATNQDSYDKIVISDRYDQPYILLLFYLKYQPEKFQKEHFLSLKDEFGFSTVRQFGKFYFEPIDFLETLISYPNSLIVGTPEQIPEEAHIIKRIYGTNGYEYFEAVEN